MSQERISGISLDDIRPRIYQAVRAAVLETADPEARAAALGRSLTAILANGPRQAGFPEELAEARQAALQAAVPRAVQRCRRLAGEWFAWEETGIDWVQELTRAVAQLVREDEATAAEEAHRKQKTKNKKQIAPPLPPPNPFFRLRQRWCGDAAAPETFQMAEWPTEVGFFSRKLLEIGSWARLFHTLAALHREGAADPAARQHALKQLLAQVEAGQPLESIPELAIYLEGAALAQEQGDAFPGPLPPPLAAEVFFPRQDLAAILALFQAAFKFLIGPDREPDCRRRLNRLAAHRELMDLKDLLLLFLSAVQGQDPLPPPSAVLDGLQKRGYPILHQDFRDEYRAWLAPLEGLAETARVTLRWPLDPVQLTGDPGLDLDFSRERQARRRQALQSFQEEALAFLTGRGQPLPQAELIRPAARFAVAWLSAAHCQGDEPLPAESLAEAAGELLAQPLLKLVRPRKGYELTHRSQLKRFLAQESQVYREVLEHRRRGHIANLYDDGLLYRLACAQALRELQPDLAALTAETVLGLEMGQADQAMADLAQRLSLDLDPGASPYWHEFQEWLKERLDWPSLVPANDCSGENPPKSPFKKGGLPFDGAGFPPFLKGGKGGFFYPGVRQYSLMTVAEEEIGSGDTAGGGGATSPPTTDFFVTENRKQKTENSLEYLFHDLARHLYRLVVARARHQRGLPPLPGDRALLGWLAAWFTPFQPALKEQIAAQLLKNQEARARQAVWESYPLIVESREELLALGKFFLARELDGDDLETYAQRRHIGDLARRAAQPLERCQIPAKIIPPGGLAAFLQELLRPRAPEDTQARRQLAAAVLALLPRSDCGSCGVPGCWAFARLVVQGQAQASQCLQSSPETRVRLQELLAQAPAAAQAPEPYALTEADHRRLATLLNPYEAALRHRLHQELAQGNGQALVPLKLDEISILQIGKSPDAATFHRYLADYLGKTAVQRLTARDRAFLGEYGEVRLAAESREMEESFSWMAQELRGSLSVFALAPKDPAAAARQVYEDCLFLNDLSAGDQARVMDFRLRQFLPDFLADWERALPEHWQAGYRIEDWEDFSQITAKSFWHQEHTPGPGEILRQLPPALFHHRRVAQLAETYLEGLVREQLARLEECRVRLEALLRRRRVESRAEMDFLVQGLVSRAWQEAAAPQAPDFPAASGRVNRLNEVAWQYLEQANLTIAGGLRIHRDELSPRVLELITASPLAALEEIARLQAGKEGLTWGEMRTLRATWLKAHLQATAERLLRAEREVTRLQQGEMPFPTPGSLRRAARLLYWSGVRTLPDLLEALKALVERYPDGRRAVTEAALRAFIWDRLISQDFLKKSKGRADDLTKAVDQLLHALFALDLPKLRAYMFLLARQEGNLDKLTALLREIRETSDIMEAAWLAFTEEIAGQALAGGGEGPPLAAARLPDQERLNRYLQKGLPRGEPPEYAQAYREIINLLQFYVVCAAPEDTPEQLLGRLDAEFPDLGGLSREALAAALTQQAQQRERLWAQRIAICTSVLAHRLAARHPRLAAAAAAFGEQKAALLKKAGPPAGGPPAQAAAARGVALAGIKNELYLQIADLLKEERTASFARRIGQITARLEEERRQTLKSFRRGELNRQTAFYLLRRWQKDQKEVSAADLGRFLRQYQPQVLAQLRERLAPATAAEVDRRLAEMMASYRQALTS